jgi:GT2 family glycosyltransferase
MDISILIVNYNTRDLLISCLKTIYQFPKNLTFEVLVSENGSNDGTEEAVREKFPQVRVIQNGRNLGFGTAMNIAVSQARGRYLVALNPDTMVPHNTLRYMLDYLESHSEIKVVACRLVGRDGRAQLSCARFPTPLRVFFLFTRLVRILPISALQTYYDRYSWRHLFIEDRNHDEPREVDTVLGALFMMPLEIFKQSGGFDKRYFMYYEEVDLFRKIRDMGHRVLFLPEVYVVHYGGEATKQEYVRMRFEQQRSLLLYLQKWHGTLAAEMIRWFLVVLAILRIGWMAVSPKVRHMEIPKQLQIRSTALFILRGLLGFNLRRNSLAE